MRLNKNDSTEQKSWFYRWVVNNRLVAALIVVIVLLAAVYMMCRVSFIFEPITALFTAVGAPMITAGIFYYLLIPIVNWANRKFRWSKQTIVLIIFLIVFAILILGIIFISPIIRTNFVQFAKHWPDYYKHWSRQLLVWLDYPALNPIKNWALDANNNLNKTIIDWSRSYLSNGIAGVGWITRFLTMTAITLVTFPFMLYYMLKESDKFPKYISQFFPEKTRSSLMEVLYEINKQISDYLRGQILTALAVSIMFMIGFSVIGLPYGIWIGLLAGPLNLIPYLGSFLAMVPAIIIALLGSTNLLLAVLVVFAIEQTLESRLIHPKIMGASMHIHPVTILVILLAAGEMFGLLGVAFGIPAYAVLKVLISRIYLWWRQNSELFKS
ncbi:MAG: AI-2E family transporter [Oenococcus sp.]|uniref:AI-2E family transporter n=1 Tax=Oenococcus sp. TaxID=1979414 RepID=UPI0039E84492